MLTTDTQRYFRDCGMAKYYYETIKVNVKETGNYSFGSIGTAVVNISFNSQPIFILTRHIYWL
jgi:hypothetical protein